MLATARIAAEHELFERIRQVAQMCTATKSWYLGPMQVNVPKGSCIGSAVFTWLSSMTTTQTDVGVNSYGGLGHVPIPLDFQHFFKSLWHCIKSDSDCMRLSGQTIYSLWKQLL